MNIYKVGLLLFLSISLNKLLAQDSIKIDAYLGRKISTIVEYHNINIDSPEKYNRGMDSLNNCNQKIQWETLLKANKNKVVTADRSLKRMKVAYSNNSNYFFDSRASIKFSGFSSVINEIYNELTGKEFKEIVPVYIQEGTRASNFIDKPNLYNISPYDTAKYILNIFFFQNIPIHCNVNDKWNDTLITEKAVLLNSFTIRSISKNHLILSFKNSIIALNHNRKNQSNPNNQTRINIYENSTITEGFMNIDPGTHLIYSIQATTTKEMESNISGGVKRVATVKSKFTLYNSIE